MPTDLEQDELAPITDATDNLDDLEDSQFDELLNELEAISVDEETETETSAIALTETSSDSEQIDEPALSDADFVEIDNLLHAMEQSDVDPERFNHLNVDVGLDEFADIIGEHNKMDVDQEDAGFAGKLDLIRAYIEMDEPESATLLIDEILTSAAPAHVKDEAKALRPN